MGKTEVNSQCCLGAGACVSDSPVPCPELLPAGNVVQQQTSAGSTPQQRAACPKWMVSLQMVPRRSAYHSLRTSHQHNLTVWYSIRVCVGLYFKSIDVFLLLLLSSSGKMSSSSKCVEF